MVELIFMMFVLKIPIVSAGLLCWWAIKSEPKPLEPALMPAALPDEPGPAPWRRPRHGPRRPGPHGGPVRCYVRTRRAETALQ